jgi:hypothetical protein
VAGDIGDLEEIRATLDSAGDEAGAQAMAGKGNGIEAKLPGGDLDDCGDVARREVVLQNFNSKLVMLDSRTGNGAGSEGDDEDDFGASESAQQVKNRPSRARPGKRGDMDDEIPF